MTLSGRGDPDKQTDLPAPAGTEAVRDRCLRLLERWPRAIERHFYRIPGHPELACFGPGHHGHWAMQANTAAAGALAVLGMDERADFHRAGMSRDEAIAWALRFLRFTLHAHAANGGTALDRHPWGGSWISALCLERMMHGVERLEPLLDDADRERLRRVMISESDWLVDRYHRGGDGAEGEVTAGLTKNNHPESNIWNGCLLHRTALMFPDAPRGGDYFEQGAKFLLNGISLEEDAVSRQLFYGRPLCDWHTGANFFPSFALNHHGYLNVGYMAICLSNIAMMHFSCRRRGWDAPAGLDHHARDLWRLVKTCTFPDGRLLRIGGDNRVRYGYCQDYALPVWTWAIDRFGDSEAEAFEKGWLGQVERDVAANPDSAFLSGRLARMEAVSPLYYIRLEGDRAVALSMAACWHARHDAEWARRNRPPGEAPVARTRWSDDFHRACLVKGPRRTASWVWTAAESPQGLCLPSDASGMAEWRCNLASRICGIGWVQENATEPGQCEMFDGGFATCGSVLARTLQPLSEGDLAAEIARVDLGCAALPDDATLVILQRARAIGRGYLRERKGLFLQVPNDVFNGGKRTYRTAEGVIHAEGFPRETSVIDVPGSWVEVDGALSVHRVYGPGLSILRPANRRVTLRPTVAKPHVEQAGGTLYTDEIVCGVREDVHSVDDGETLFDLGVVLAIGGDGTETPESRAARFSSLGEILPPEVRGLRVLDARGNDNILLANFSTSILEVTLPGVDPARFTSLTGNVAVAGGGRDDPDARVHLPPRGLVILRNEPS